jgi:hypothetical protein
MFGWIFVNETDKSINRSSSLMTGWKFLGFSYHSQIIQQSNLIIPNIEDQAHISPRLLSISLGERRSSYGTSSRRGELARFTLLEILEIPTLG